jgi:hypothetical protein
MAFDPAVQPRAVRSGLRRRFSRRSEGSSQIETLRLHLQLAGNAGVWQTLAELREITGWGEASISAQIRNLRKPAHGSHIIEKRRRVDADAPMGFCWEYRMMVR